MIVRKLKVQIQRASVTSFDQPCWDDVQDAISTVLNLICTLARLISAIPILPRDPANRVFTFRSSFGGQVFPLLVRYAFLLFLVSPG
jgi:hypothetical protein